MGGATSRFGDTDRDTFNGGLTAFDGAKLTKEHVILTLSKRNIVNQRDFEIKDDQDMLICKSKAVKGTMKWFDLEDKGGRKTFEHRQILFMGCCIPCDLGGSTL